MRLKIGAGLLLAGAAMAQSAAPKLSFEVASVKPAAPITSKIGLEGKLKLGTQVDAGRADFSFVSLSDLVCQAYNLKSYQLQAPDWMSAERYDIHAKLPNGTTKEQVPEMIQSLLDERFHLKYHLDKKEHQVYALVEDKGGVKLAEAEPDPPTPDGGATVNRASAADGGGVRVFSSTGGGSAATSAAGEKAMVFSRSTAGAEGQKLALNGGSNIKLDRKMTMQQFADFLSRFVDKPVLDKTGLKPTYQFKLDLPLDELLRSAKAGGNVIMVGGGGAVPLGAAGGDTASEPAGSSAMIGAVKQMGLKLDQRKEMMDILVVERAEKVPTEN